MKLIRELDLNKVIDRPDWMEIEYSTSCTDPKEEINYTITISTYGEAFSTRPLIMSVHVDLDKRIALIKSDHIKSWENGTLVFIIDNNFTYSKDPKSNKLNIMQVELLDIILANSFEEFQDYIYIAPVKYPLKGVKLTEYKNKPKSKTKPKKGKK